MRYKKPYTLTRSEMQVMNILWDLPDGGCVHDIIARYEEPKPAYATIATFMRILYNKGFIRFQKSQGKTYTYYPLTSRDEYVRNIMNDVKENFFAGSRSSFIKFFVHEENISEEEIRELLGLAAPARS